MNARPVLVFSMIAAGVFAGGCVAIVGDFPLANLQRGDAGYDYLDSDAAQDQHDSSPDGGPAADVVIADGPSDSGIVDAPPSDAADSGADKVLQIASGPQISCAVTRAGFVYCWGSNQYGAVGDGTTMDRYRPTRVALDADGQAFDHVTQVTLGASHACARKDDSSVWCWGADPVGQLGDGRTIPDGGFAITAAPHRVQTSAAGVVAGFFHTCTFDVTGGLVCFGSNGSGELGHTPGTEGDTTVPFFLGSTEANGVPLNGPKIPEETQISLGYFFGCARKLDTSVWCWGANDLKALGVPDAGSTAVPIQVHGDQDQGFLADVTSVSAFGVGHACALTNAGDVWCWGEADVGQLGPYVPLTQGATSTAVKVTFNMSAVSVGGYATCAIDQNTHVVCWGANDHGQLGHDPASDIQACPGNNKPCNPTPKAINDSARGVFSNAAAIAVGGEHACALKTDGTVWCWGDDSLGQLGDGSGGPDGGVQYFPVQVTGLP